MNQRKGGNNQRYYFMIKLHESRGSAWVELDTPGSAVRHVTNCPTWPGDQKSITSVVASLDACKGDCMVVHFVLGGVFIFFPCFIISHKQHDVCARTTATYRGCDDARSLRHPLQGSPTSLGQQARSSTPSPGGD